MHRIRIKRQCDLYAKIVGLFEHFRTIGLVNSVDGVPMAVNTLGTETFLVASIGHAWQVILCWKQSIYLVREFDMAFIAPASM